MRDTVLHRSIRKSSPYLIDAEKVNEILDKRGWSAYDLATKVGTTNPTIYRHLTNQNRNLIIQRAIAKALRVPLKRIIKEPDDEARAA